MQEHFIPQDISNYKFHLIGELDLQQFLEILAGVILAVIIYNLGLPGILAWPLMIFSVGLGLIAAFVPIADQPLSHWLKVFFRLLSAPTKFYWRKEIIIPAYFTYELPSEHQSALASQETFNATPVKRHRALDYFTSLDQKNNQAPDQLEIFSPTNIQAAMTQFNINSAKETSSLSPNIPRKKVLRKPSLQEGQSLRIRPIIAPSQKNIDSFINTAMSKPTKLVTKIAALDEKTLGWPQAKLANQQKPVLKPPVLSATPSSPASSSPTITSVSFSRPVSQNVTTPVSTQPTQAGTKNFLLKGKVITADNRPLSEAILSVKDGHGNFKFLLRSDEQGNFISHQPLNPGAYQVSTQKEAHTFTDLTINFTAQGAEPILLKAN